MASRLELQNKLEEIFESKNVYYQPPENIKMNYPAIVYSKNNIESKFADDTTYTKLLNYKIIVIDKKPDNPVIDKLLQLPLCSFEQHYNMDNLNHDVFSLYF